MVKIIRVLYIPKRKNPPSQPALETKLGISHCMLSNIIHQDLQLETRKKTKTHHLTPQQMSQRVIRGEIFLSYLGMYKTRMIFTMDETLITLNDFNCERPFYYVGWPGGIPEDWTKISQKCHPKQIMVAFGICWNGISRPYFIEPKAKINADYFTEHVLIPMLEYDIPHLFPGQEKNVIFHMDSAPAHTAKKTVQEFTKRHRKFIPKGHWMANSPDEAPNDYGMNGILKENLKHRRPRCVNGMKDCIRDELSKFNLDTIRAILYDWKPRVELMLKLQGNNIEHVWKK